MSREEIRQLAEVQQPRCLTITLPASLPLDAKQAVHAVLAKARTLLQEAGLPMREADRRLRKVISQLEDPALWQQSGYGLIAFIADNSVRCFRVTGCVAESVLLGDRFDLGALLQVLANTQQFAVLAISESKVRLIRYRQGNPPQELELAMATNLNAFSRWEDREEQLQWHSTGTARNGRAPVAFHGGGSWDDYERHEEHNFHVALAKAVQHALATQTPLVLAGVRKTTEALRHVLHGCDVVPTSIHGNPDQLSLLELQLRALPLVQEHQLHKNLERATAAQSMNQRHTCGTIEEVAQAAGEGRIQTLFVALMASSEAHVTENAGGSPALTDLIGCSIRNALRFGGEVLVVPAQTLSEPMLGILRYRPQASTIFDEEVRFEENYGKADEAEHEQVGALLRTLPTQDDIAEKVLVN